MLPLDLPSVVWKPLVGQQVGPEDIEAIDSLCFNVLDQVANIETQNVTRETFEDVITNSFVATSSDGREIELKENGSNIPVTWDTRKEYVELVRNYRLQEFTAQVDAIRRGLGTIVPVPLLPLFTWQELEMMVCGKRIIDIGKTYRRTHVTPRSHTVRNYLCTKAEDRIRFLLDYLRANTKYRNPVTASDKHIKMLWEVLTEFSHDERQMFLRFVWGQSRLPYNPADFVQKFEITETASRSRADMQLPVAHTCFFSVELPRYTSKAVMSAKLKYAFTNCVSIDGVHLSPVLEYNVDLNLVFLQDFAAANVDWDA